MKVLHVVTAFPRHEEDVITPWLVELLLALRERGVQPEVLAPSYRGEPTRRLHDIPVRRFRYAPQALETLTHDETVPERLARKPVYAALLPGYIAGGLVAARRAGRSAPDVVHVHWPMPHALFGAAARRASRGRTALVCSYYSVELNWVEKREPWLMPLLRWSIRTADAATAISTATAARVQGVWERPVSIVPFGAAVEPSSDQPIAPPFAKDGPIRLLFVGRLVERKGIEYLVRALARVAHVRPATLTVVGEGEWESEIRQAVERSGMSSRVHFTGFVPKRELTRLYGECDLFVLPAVVDRKGDTEGLGVVLLEALSFGRPVIASDVGGIPDIVRPGETGWLVKPGDPGALAATILEAARDPSEARRRAARGLKWVEERFAVPRVADSLIACYKSAIEHRRSMHPGSAR
jgi:glycosyltransferase involved in cell wall biosynthesis